MTVRYIDNISSLQKYICDKIKKQIESVECIFSNKQKDQSIRLTFLHALNLSYACYLLEDIYFSLFKIKYNCIY